MSCSGHGFFDGLLSPRWLLLTTEVRWQFPTVFPSSSDMASSTCHTTSMVNVGGRAHTSTRPGALKALTSLRELLKKRSQTVSLAKFVQDFLVYAEANYRPGTVALYLCRYISFEVNCSVLPVRRKISQVLQM